jgi:hypothetical protein
MINNSKRLNGVKEKNRRLVATEDYGKCKKYKIIDNEYPRIYTKKNCNKKIPS